MAPWITTLVLGIAALVAGGVLHTRARGDVARAEGVHLDGTGANALATVYEVPAVQLEPGEVTLWLRVADRFGGERVSLSALSQELPGWRHTAAGTAAGVVTTAAVEIPAAGAYSFYVELSGVHSRAPLELRASRPPSPVVWTLLGVGLALLTLGAYRASVAASQ